MTIYVDCRKNYTRKHSIVAAIKKQYEDPEASSSPETLPRTKARVSVSAFCFEKQSPFCGQNLNKEHEKRKPWKDSF